jgi:hypothetical protein
MVAIVIEQDKFNQVFKDAATCLALTKFQAQAEGRFATRDPELPADVKAELSKQLTDMHRAFHFHLYTAKTELER